MRVLFLNPIAEIGGAERVLLTAVRGVREAAPDAEVRLLTVGDGPLSEQARILGAAADTIAMPARLARLGDSASSKRRTLSAVGLAAAAPRALQFAWRLRRRILDWSPDIVHSNGVKTNLLAAAILPASIPLVWHVHDFYSARPLVPRALRLVHRRVSKAVAISGAIARDLRRLFPKLPVALVFNRVDTTRFRPDGPIADLDRMANMPPAPPSVVRIGLVATYARWKGHDVFLEAARRVLTLDPSRPVRFYVVGGPIYQTSAQYSEAELRESVESLGLRGQVGFVGFQSDVAPIYRALDVVVHASTSPEPFGMTILEAMACGRPVVVSAAGGAAELFTPGVDGIGVTPGDPDALATALGRLAADAGLRCGLGDEARTTAVRKFDAGSYGSELLAIYQDLLSDD